MKKLIIIPAYNEEDNIKRIVEDIKNTTKGYDYIVINDCSTDKTAQICSKNNIKSINLSINLGIGGAVQTGYLYAFKNNYDIAIQIDGDGQHDPKYLDDLTTPIEQNRADITIGSRFIQKEGFQSSRLRRIGITYFKWLIKTLSGTKITDATSGFRACNAKIIEYFSKNYPKDYPEPESIMMVEHEGFRVMEVPVVMRERTGGVSSIRRLKSAYYMIKVSIAIFIARFKPQKISQGVKKHA